MKEFDEEAKAFDDRINARTEQGFVPDLRRLVPNEYFYKSFWRHPHYADLYVGTMYRNYIKYIRNYSFNGCRVLDMGCGAGYFALELARDGCHVVGIDISESNIDKAKKVLAENTFTENFGSLEYAVASYQDLNKFGSFDVILSSGFMHHIPKIEDAIDHMHSALKPDGYIIWHEPQHKSWTQFDAAFALSMRLILSQSGLWFEPDLHQIETGDELLKMVEDIQNEYIFERDINETGGQSPNDLSCDAEQIIKYMNKKFEIVETKPSFSFIYRLLGGMRGEQSKLNEMASLLALIDETYVKKGILQANYFYGVAHKNG